MYDQKNETEEGSNPQFIIQMFGINETGETASIQITNYNPFFYVKVGRHWNEGDAHELLSDIRKKLYKQIADAVLKVELVEHHKLYGFSAGITFLSDLPARFACPTSLLPGPLIGFTSPTESAGKL